MTFIFALLTQAGFLLYMAQAIIYAEPPKSTCQTPALLQLFGLCTFSAACVQELTSLRLLLVALYCQRLRVPASPAPDSQGRLTMGADVILDVRPTSTRARMMLALAPLLELTIELSTLCIGGVYLIVSENTEELILNAVAVNFVTQIDDVMLAAFVHKASKERLSKYQFEQLFGIEDGDTQLKSASATSLRLSRAQELLPLVVTVIAAAAVCAGQAWGSIINGETCSWVIVAD